jgi:uncharacterized lipoprotein YmbA
MVKVSRSIVFLLLLAIAGCTSQNEKTAVFKISFTKELSDQAQDGRLLLMLANNDKSDQ